MTGFGTIFVHSAMGPIIIPVLLFILSTHHLPQVRDPSSEWYRNDPSLEQDPANCAML